jgi:type II secretory pathway pseudopilin PulG
MNNAKHYIIIIAISLLIGATITFAWSNKTIEQQIEEHNQEVLTDCLTKARVQKTTKEILEYASNCNKDILTTISTPRPVETIT